MFRGLAFLLLSYLVVNPTIAQNWSIQSNEDASRILAAVQDGDQVTVKAGNYAGPWNILASIQLHAEDGAVLDGQNQGHGLVIHKANTYVSGLRIENWGDDLGELHSGVFVQKQAQGSVLEKLSLQGTSFGIWIDATQDVKIKHCKIQGDLNTRSQDRGNGIHLFNVTGTWIEGNEVWHTRDGIYIDTSNKNDIIGNYFHDLRYGVHYMYSHYNKLERNITERTRTGYALMQSHHLDVRHNISRNDLNYGILMNYITYSKLKHNQVINTSQGRNAAGDLIVGADGKSLFVYHSVFNEIAHNEFSQSDLAIHLTAGSSDNKIYGNAFVGNRSQVKYVSNRQQEWSYEGQGNYWSDYMGWDLDGDGFGDSQYEPNDGIDKLLWKYPSARILFNSPGILLMRWVEKQFPVLKRPGIKDSYPLIAQPKLSGDEEVSLSQMGDQTQGPDSGKGES